MTRHAIPCLAIACATAGPAAAAPDWPGTTQLLCGALERPLMELDPATHGVDAGSFDEEAPKSGGEIREAPPAELLGPDPTLDGALGRPDDEQWPPVASASVHPDGAAHTVDLSAGSATVMLLPDEPGPVYFAVDADVDVSARDVSGALVESDNYEQPDADDHVCAQIVSAGHVVSWDGSPVFVTFVPRGPVVHTVRLATTHVLELPVAASTAPTTPSGSAQLGAADPDPAAPNVATSSADLFGLLGAQPLDAAPAERGFADGEAIGGGGRDAAGGSPTTPCAFNVTLLSVKPVDAPFGDGAAEFAFWTTVDGDLERKTDLSSLSLREGVTRNVLSRVGSLRIPCDRQRRVPIRVRSRELDRGWPWQAFGALDKDEEGDQTFYIDLDCLPQHPVSHHTFTAEMRDRWGTVKHRAELTYSVEQANQSVACGAADDDVELRACTFSLHLESIRHTDAPLLNKNGDFRLDVVIPAGPWRANDTVLTKHFWLREGSSRRGWKLFDFEMPCGSHAVMPIAASMNEHDWPSPDDYGAHAELLWASCPLSGGAIHRRKTVHLALKDQGSGKTRHRAEVTFRLTSTNNNFCAPLPVRRSCQYDVVYDTLSHVDGPNTDKSGEFGFRADVGQGNRRVGGDHFLVRRGSTKSPDTAMGTIEVPCNGRVVSDVPFVLTEHDRDPAIEVNDVLIPLWTNQDEQGGGYATFDLSCPADASDIDTGVAQVHLENQRGSVDHRAALRLTADLRNGATACTPMHTPAASTCEVAASIQTFHLRKAPDRVEGITLFGETHVGNDSLRTRAPRRFFYRGASQVLRQPLPVDPSRAGQSGSLRVPVGYPRTFEIDIEVAPLDFAPTVDTLSVLVDCDDFDEGYVDYDVPFWVGPFQGTTTVRLEKL